MQGKTLGGYFRWEKWSCQVWQVRGLPCAHATAFIAFTRDANWEKYVDPYFTIEKFQATYSLEIAPMQGKDQWGHVGIEETIYPPTIKRLVRTRHLIFKKLNLNIYGCPYSFLNMTIFFFFFFFKLGYDRGKKSQAHRSKKSKPCDAMNWCIWLSNSCDVY